MNIGFIGVGKLGKDAAEVMHDAGHNVLGYDVKLIPDTNFTMTTSLEDVCKHAEMIFIAVPTPHHPFTKQRLRLHHCKRGVE
jgi:3-hydroxyisobutyrate dehydrogenase-like beta-hydroxyacid dehydrogenase